MPKLALDPPVSEAQRRAMWAAAKGNSTLGIPKKVGKEFVGDAKTRAAGVAFVTPIGEALFLLRSEKGDHPGEWCFPGGTAEGNETPEETALREVEEETGVVPKAGPEHLDQRTSSDGVDFVTFRQDVTDKWKPVLNDEHIEARWAPIDDPPKPLHPGVKAVLDKLAMDSRMIAFDRLPLGRRLMAGTADALKSRAGLAFDRGTVRSYDRDGRMRVEITNISKAAVNPYVGHEIPDWKKLGLEPEKIYQLFRDPAELEKAAPSSNGVPVLLEHVAVTADDHQPDLVVGSTGTDGIFQAPFLRNSLVLWARDGIDAVESEEQKELSCAYHYRADMTPGSYEGQSYDGVMRDIVFNHVALVEEGRAGADVVVGDSMEAVLMNTKSKLMSRTGAVSLGALAVFLAPKLAQDAKLDITPALAGLTAKNFKTEKPKILERLTALTKDKLAKDASLEGVVELLDRLETVAGDEPPQDANSSLPIVGMGPNEDEDDETMDADPMGPAKEFLKGKLSAEDMKTFDEMCAKKTGMDETQEAKAEREKKEQAAKDEAAEKEKNMVTKPVMDAAIKVAVDAATQKVLADQKDLREAEEFVRPWVGKLAMAHDSAAAVFRTAIGALPGVKVDGLDTLPVPALKAILSAHPKPGERRKADTSLAMDAGGDDAEFAKAYPGAANITVLG